MYGLRPSITVVVHGHLHPRRGLRDKRHPPRERPVRIDSSSSPSSAALPASARRMRSMHLISVLLPAPLLPSTAQAQPAGKSNDTPLRTASPPR